MLSIFIKDYAKNNKSVQAVIEQEVDNFFRTEKVSEANLKDLKARVLQIIGGKQPSGQGQSSVSAKTNVEKAQQPHQQQQPQDEVKSQASQKSHNYHN